MTDQREFYLSEFRRLEREFASDGAAWLLPVRREAIEWFAEVGFPTTRMEDWRFTNVAPIARTAFALAPAVATPEGALGRLGSVGYAARLVFVNGRFAPALSDAGELPAEVRFGSLAEALSREAARLEPHLARLAPHRGHPFVALNTALFLDGAWLELPAGLVLERPVLIVHVAAGADEPAMASPRTLVVAGPSSQACIVEAYLGAGSNGAALLTNAVSEIAAGENAVLEHVKIQLERPDGFHIGTTQVRQSRDSNVLSHSIAIGGALSRNDLNIVLAEEGAEATLNGLYLGTDHQLVDNHTGVDHAAPHCNSHEFYNGVLDAHARGVFNGKILVRPGAQKTDAKQTNRNLLLSEDAVINTKPQLEIFADDVRCTHGATVGQLDEEAIFYMRARGIARDDARHILTHAFAGEILDRVRPADVRERLHDWLHAWLRRGLERRTREA